MALVIMETLWLKTGNPKFHNMCRYWTRVFALTFAIGVATGIVMEFEFGTNWASYSRVIGDIFRGASVWVEQSRASHAFFCNVDGLFGLSFWRSVIVVIC